MPSSDANRDTIDRTAEIAAIVQTARSLRNSDPARGAELARQAVVTAREQLAATHDDAWRLVLAEALAAQGHCCRRSGELGEAITACSEAALLFESLGQAYPESLARSQWGIALVQMGDLSSGLVQLEQALRLTRAVGNREHEWDCLLDIGVVCNMLGDDARAIELYSEALAGFESCGDGYHAASCLNNMAYAHICWGRRERVAGDPASAQAHFAKARKLAERAISLAGAADDIDFYATCHNTLAEAQREAGDLAACLDTLHRQLALTDRVMGQRGRAICLYGLADALIERGLPADLTEAERLLQQADDLCRMHQLAEIHSSVLRSLSRLYERRGHWEKALAAFRAYHEFELRLRSEAAQRSAQALEARLRVERMQEVLAQARAREQELSLLTEQLRVQQAALERLANLDSLTGIANRREWWRRFSAAWSDRPESLVLLLIDLDHFKRINDEFGHATGDAVLVSVAAALARIVEGKGCAGRFGGEEFVVWARVDDAQDAARLADSIASALRTVPAAIGHAGLRVSASIGACLGDASLSPESCIARADQAMYSAKRSGRDRVVFLTGC